jgi:hypothetical protein
MKQLRTLLFYTCSEEYGIRPYPFSNLEPHSSLAEVVHMLVVAIAVMANRSVSPSQKDYSEDYDFYDWDLQKLERKTTVRKVPNPGIVFAIKKGTFDLDTVSAATIVKLRVEGSEDKTQLALLESFLSGSDSNESLRQELRQHQSNLNKLREQAAIYGPGETPLHILNKIEHEEERIAELKVELDYDS